MRFHHIVMIAVIFLFACRNRTAAPQDTDVYYTCSMDPQVVEYKPGTCPICKMELTPVKKSNGVKSDEIQLSDQQIRLGNIKTDTIRNGSLGDQLILTATLNIDQQKTSSASSRVMGRIEKLYFKSIGDFIAKGAPLYDLYSEDLNNAKQEYLLALERKQEFSNETVIDFRQLIQSAKNKLLLWGMTEIQIQELAGHRTVSPGTTFYSPEAGFVTEFDVGEGDYVMQGGTIVKLADLSMLWAEAQVYTSQIPGIDRNSLALVQFPDLEGRTVRSRIEFVNPEIAPDTRINLLRVSVPNPGNLLKPGMPAYVLLKSPPKKYLSLPVDAVIRDSKGSSVWLKTGSNTFKPVMVTTGLESENQIAILSGLQEGDLVVFSGAYLLNSEFIFKKGVNPMAGHKHE